MADITLTAGSTTSLVLVGDLVLPRTGNWTAHVEADGDAAPVGAVTLRWLGTDLSGYVLRAGIHERRVTALIVGGAGGLWQDGRAQEYTQELASGIVQQILGDVGERLSATADAALLAQVLPRWVRQAESAGAQLDRLMGALGASWRVLADGSVWIGAESWPVTTATPEVLDQDPTAGLLVLAPEDLGLRPGQAYQGLHVGAVVYELTQAGESRARVWAQLETEESDDPLRVQLAALISEHPTVRAVEYHALYPARVVTQRPSGTVDLAPDLRRLPTLTDVPLRVPCHGAKLSLPAGARVLLGWEEGDPRRPIATALYEPSGSGHKAVARVGDRTAGHAHTVSFTLSAGMTAVTGTITVSEETDEIAEGSPHLSLLPGSTV